MTTDPTPTPEQPRHGYTCAYCTGDGSGHRREWMRREDFEYHMATLHHGLPYEARPEQDEAVRLTGEALYRTYWQAAVVNSQDWPTQWERLSHPTRAVWDSFAAALATPPPVPAAPLLDVERLARVLSDHFGPSYFPGMTDVTIHGKSPGAIAEQIAAEYARLSHQSEDALDIDQLQQDGAQE